MATRTVGVSEARRLLPRLVEDISAQGGRIDITRRGAPGVSLVRTADLAAKPAAAALRVEFVSPPGDLVELVRELRGRAGRARVIEAVPKPRRAR